MTHDIGRSEPSVLAERRRTVRTPKSALTWLLLSFAIFLSPWPQVFFSVGLCHDPHRTHWHVVRPPAHRPPRCILNVQQTHVHPQVSLAANNLFVRVHGSSRSRAAEEGGLRLAKGVMGEAGLALAAAGAAAGAGAAAAAATTMEGTRPPPPAAPGRSRRRPRPRSPGETTTAAAAVTSSLLAALLLLVGGGHAFVPPAAPPGGGAGGVGGVQGHGHHHQLHPAPQQQQQQQQQGGGGRPSSTRLQSSTLPRQHILRFPAPPPLIPPPPIPAPPLGPSSSRNEEEVRVFGFDTICPCALFVCGCGWWLRTTPD